MKRKITINEDKFNRLFNDINEISHKTVQNASDVSEHVFYDMRVAFDDFYDTVKYNPDGNNPYVKKIKAYADAIDAILSQKGMQRKNFDNELNKFDYEKFYADNSDEDYDNLDLKYLQNKYPKDKSNMRFDGRHMVNK